VNWPQLTWWEAFGGFGQVVFFCRFLLQWIVSEKQGRSVVPMPFWILSLVGSAIILIYAIHLKNVVFIAGQSIGSFIYIRNLMLIRKRAKRAQE